MSETLSEEQLKGIANQLSCPTGEGGLKTAENMALHNDNMISVTIDALTLQNADAVLEIGPGSATHLDKLFVKAAGLSYTGADISDLMISEAMKNNTALVKNGQAGFFLSDGKTLDFENNTFDKIFTVNTLYFWNDPVGYASEILKVLKPGGMFCLCFAPKEFMVKLPFTGYVFKLYSLEDAQAVLTSAGFDIVNVGKYDEEVRSNAGETISRDFIVITAGKK
ncbi:class I SAM-dependent methyltransferase [Pedobacter psychroterrae]|uniref:Class I SAM-dependent methyltransferase n=1 Tax=Pedobacter psychroterrae TaxID=2530453 RepID=A0A4R0NP35_9SPHI|nr:class I SAM-dependent methyltransferase [Pedobacter psychroterrae]TCD00934.1 class I SAM-dependent methyltransferase [Pedobacter psychroterrae]